MFPTRSHNPWDVKTRYIPFSALQEGQWVKNLPAVQETQETWAQSLGWEDPPQEGTQPTPVFWPGGSSWREEPGGLYSPWGHKEPDTTDATEHARTLGTSGRSGPGSFLRERGWGLLCRVLC